VESVLAEVEAADWTALTAVLSVAGTAAAAAVAAAATPAVAVGAMMSMDVESRRSGQIL
jgi:hypothetical protein